MLVLGTFAHVYALSEIPDESKSKYNLISMPFPLFSIYIIFIEKLGGLGDKKYTVYAKWSFMMHAIELVITSSMVLRLY